MGVSTGNHPANEPANEPGEVTGVAALASALWDVREAMGLVLFKLAEERLVVAAGQTRWLAWSSCSMAFERAFTLGWKQPTRADITATPFLPLMPHDHDHDPPRWYGSNFARPSTDEFAVNGRRNELVSGSASPNPLSATQISTLWSAASAKTSR